MQMDPIELVQEQFSVPRTAPVYDSARRGFIAIDEIREVIRYRELIYQLVRRDIVARYKRSVLGIAWTMLNPLGMMIVLTIVFSQIFKTVPGYPAYVLSGLIAWNFFSQTTMSIISSFVWGGDFFQRIYLPRSIFAISAIGTGLVNLFLSFVPLFAVMLVIGFPIQPAIILEPIPILLFAFFALGFGLLVSSIAVFFPDVVEMYQIVLMAWSYLSAIFYPLDILPKAMLPLMQFNPMLPMINLFRMPIYQGKIPGALDFLPALVITLVTFSCGWWLFAKKSDEFAYRA
jgi:ABC-2 type transport system permease protein